ncbi:MAG: hypothetical protein JSW51_06575 [Gemmatimonadota bacterium]|nr:MAG: hypothetical protein JSW51_06575 [Gemmatimonadota bacterium]
MAIAIGVAAWYFRADIADAYRKLTGAEGTASGSLTVGYPSDGDLFSAEQKEGEIAQRDGRSRIVMTAEEMASIVQDRLPSQAKRALDSLGVILERDRFSIQAELLTEIFGRDLLGPLQGIIDPREPIRISGPLEMRGPGVVAWNVDEFVIASFPFPGPAIPLLVDRLTGGTDGVLLIAVPPTVGAIRVRSDGVTFYRRDE